MESDTPRTDAFAKALAEKMDTGYDDEWYDWHEHARQLEREVREATDPYAREKRLMLIAENEALRKTLEVAQADAKVRSSLPPEVGHTLQPSAAQWLAGRIAWLKKEWEAGGDFEHLNTRRKEAIVIAEKFGVEWDKPSTL